MVWVGPAWALTVLWAEVVPNHCPRKNLWAQTDVQNHGPPPGPAAESDRRISAGRVQPGLVQEGWSGAHESTTREYN